jgi:hypothetical protein
MSARLDNVLMVHDDDEPPSLQPATPKMSKQAMELTAKFATIFFTVSSRVCFFSGANGKALAGSGRIAGPAQNVSAATAFPIELHVLSSC